MAIAVKICDGDGNRKGTPHHGIALGGLERAVAPAQQDADAIATTAVITLIDHCQIEVAVAIEVSHRHGSGTNTDSVVLGTLERAVALAQQDTYRAVIATDHGEVWMTVAVEISHRHGIGREPGSVGGSRDKTRQRSVLQDLQEWTIT